MGYKKIVLKAATLGLGAAGIWAICFERNLFTLRHFRIPVLKKGSKPIRILHLSDIHITSCQGGKKNWLQSLAQLKPDFIINTGDNLGHAQGFGIFCDSMRSFCGIPGAFVNGSNDYFEPYFKNPFAYLFGHSKTKASAKALDTDRLRGFLTGEMKWIDLNNRQSHIRINGSVIKLIGVDDPHCGYDKLEEVLPVRGSSDVVLGLTHAPYRRVLDAYAKSGVHVIFAGHTHGGQVNLFGALTTNCDLPRFQAKGLSGWHSETSTSWLHVSAGVGTSVYAPFRFACKPEASLIELV
ncbi:metallophosphoesterase [Tropheryma whipplei]|uniref:Calcineurin-like phosphoesterase domain-containing protein n=1 Tax=Tropheryma whipplei (strain Twist) TaxID=203267 RepID=Q83FL5_TROWT|nr:metallophosphoesterase [Tropheryma whipplei]AAO44803.1 unknown [Tropheryma whipplei str. Twist]MCO8182480.1 metallophosphoesterase [Tropheryma whipplei]MCO8190324.1 metallophosphoesterase [Tropheryma whipplei]CAD67382.1 putative secreted protein [Tropheryma whipplei TW08/27]